MPTRSLLAVSIAALLSPVAVHAQDADQEDAKALEQVVVTGTRVSGRSATDTAAPIDVIRPEALERSGSPELNQALSVALPSFNFPRPSLADGTDSIRPATLRGLAPDQTLVLVNSKRRHSSALVNVNGTVGRGSAAVDLNTIPAAAVKGVEVLRDGASAQYGSDAIAGVINVLLRDNAEGGNATVSYGQRDTTYSVNVGAPPADATWDSPSKRSRDRKDGETTTVSVWKGFSFGDNGFFTLSAEYKDQEHTERSGYDVRQQYPRLADGSYDPRELTINRYNAWYGEPELEQKTVFANFGNDLSGGARLYGWASYQDRSTSSPGFFRRAVDSRNVISIYPDGFLPQIAPDVTDASFALGSEWQWGEWSMDSSLVWGRNKMDFTIENTLNNSLGANSPTRFDAGGFDYDQLVFNFSGVRSLDVGGLASPLNVATGLEARRESYSIHAGEPDSYFGTGSQVFPGTQPSSEIDDSRSAVGAYLDLEANLTERLLGSAAIRAEDYSDFGSNVSGKLALRFDVNDSFALRGSVQNGFRAPSPQQQFYTAISTNNITLPDGSTGLIEIGTFAPESVVASTLGAKPLEAEESVNYSLGAVFAFGDASLTIDAYQINIDDRIVLSENLSQSNVAAYLQSRGVNAGAARFFINGVDTETQGVDVVFNYPLQTQDIGQFDFTVAANFNNTDVTRVPTTNELSSLDPPPTLFGRVNTLIFEEGQPKDKFSTNLNWRLGRYGATLRATRYGEVLSPGATAATDFTIDPTVLVDLEARVDLTDTARLAIGAENLFDQYPDALPPNLNTSGNTPFPNLAPFGRSGRFLYARVSFDF